MTDLEIGSTRAHGKEPRERLNMMVAIPAWKSMSGGEHGAIDIMEDRLGYGIVAGVD